MGSDADAPPASGLALTLGKSGKSVEVHCAILRRGAASHREFLHYRFLDGDQYSLLDSLLVQEEPQVAFAEDLTGDATLGPELRKVLKVLERRGIDGTLLARPKFRRADVEGELRRLTGDEHCDVTCGGKKQQGCVAALITELKVMEDADAVQRRTAASASGGLDASLRGPGTAPKDQGGEGSYSVRLGNLDAVMRLDSAAVDAINLLPNADAEGVNGSLLGLLDHCKSRPGSRLLRSWLLQPLCDRAAIDARLDLVEELVGDPVLCDAMREGALRGLPDIPLLCRKLSRQQGGRAGLQELFKMYGFCTSTLPALAETVEQSSGSALKREFAAPLRKVSEECGMFVKLVEHVVDMSSLPELRVNPNFNAELADLKAQIDAALAAVDAAHQRAERLGVVAAGSIRCEPSKEHGFCFRVPGLAAQQQLRSSKHAITILNTLKNGTYFTTPDLQDAAAAHADLAEAYDAAQADLVRSAVDTGATYVPLLEAAGRTAAKLDVVCALAQAALSSSRGYCRPKMLPKGADLEVRGARHPCVEVMEDVDFIANDYVFERGASRFHIVTGPNMGGKSTYIRAIGCIAAMAQAGSFVPAASASLPVLDALLARVGASDAQQRGISTFMAEMLEAGTILEAATPDSLVIVDELGRGTSTIDGFGLAWAISDHLLRENRSLCLFATHFHEVTALAAEGSGAVNQHVAAHVADDEDITFLYEVRDGPCLESYGVHCARLAGIPDEVVEAARRKAQELEALPTHRDKRIKA